MRSRTKDPKHTRSTDAAQSGSVAKEGQGWEVDRSGSEARWSFSRPLSRREVMAVAEQALMDGWAAGPSFKSSTDIAAYFQFRLAGSKSEIFSVAFLDSRHCLIACEDMFFGSIAGSEVHPREVVRRALELNAAAVVCAHNHPSGSAEPSAADRAVTNRLRDALMLMDIRLLDHFVVGKTVESFAARGWL